MAKEHQCTKQRVGRSSDNSNQHSIDTQSTDLKIVRVLPSRWYLHSCLQLVNIVEFRCLLVYGRTLTLQRCSDSEGFKTAFMDFPVHIHHQEDITALRAVEAKLANMKAKVKYISVPLDVVE